MNMVKNKYPAAEHWKFGDSTELQDALAELVSQKMKTATSCSFSSYKQSGSSILIGNEYIVLNSKDTPTCVVRVMALHLIKFSEMTVELAWKEGEGDRSVRHWQQEHQHFFEREGSFSPDMEVVVIEFQVIDTLEE
ncbi:ASCH domain-containing protein [Xenorhabdus bharatensis]|uniref:ASCH domain-containing protein n=1 Tax=Xenorhabdus bharatensis TaxID=3136256 RepID=UPI0030F444B1